MGCGATAAKGKYAEPAGETEPLTHAAKAATLPACIPHHADARQRPEHTGSYRAKPQVATLPPGGTALPRSASPVGPGAAGGARGPRGQQVKEEHAKDGQEGGSTLLVAAAASPSDAAQAEGSTLKFQEAGSDEVLPAGHALAITCDWWAFHAEWIRQRAGEILAAYNFFFEHIGLRKGWRTAPFAKDEVQAPFQAAAEVVTVVRARLDEQKGSGVVLRQLEGSAMNFLWGWTPGRSPGASREALEDFFRGLVFATLSDGHGLVEGLDHDTVEHYVSCHPIIVAASALPSGAAAECATTAETGVPSSPDAGSPDTDSPAAGSAADPDDAPVAAEAAVETGSPPPVPAAE